MRGAKGSRLARIFNSRQTLSKALPSILTIPDSLSSAFFFKKKKRRLGWSSPYVTYVYQRLLP